MTSLSMKNYAIASLREARRRTLELIQDLSDDLMVGPRLDIVNPLRWEIGHVAWFQEYWLLRHLCGREPILSNGDALFDSAKVAHDTRWDLRLPIKAETIDYMTRVIDDISRYVDGSSRDASYFLALALFHEDMHGEAITYTRQTLGMPAPRITMPDTGIVDIEPAPRQDSDAFVPGGLFILGNTSENGFVFDNEQKSFQVLVQSFRISRSATTNGEFARFVEDSGYVRRELWSDDGWRWRETAGANHPVYWSFENGSWWRRNFDQKVPLEENHPVLHVNWHEAEAYCRWAGRRLPTEIEWEMAASSEPGSNHKRHFPWGDEDPNPARANLDSGSLGTTDVGALPAGDSAFGCRQMIGNVWEWTASNFTPYPGFVAGPYKEYSAPWFGNHKVLRGGCWVTRSRLISNTYRNFYMPDRRDVWAGFRTCAS
jgi:ergothioneine biosynthesis protein EgtB